MKAITVHRVAVRRWRVERVFWSLKFELGWKQIRDHSEQKAMARIFPGIVVYQALIDIAKGSGTFSRFTRSLRFDFRNWVTEAMKRWPAAFDFI